MIGLGKLNNRSTQIKAQDTLLGGYCVLRRIEVGAEMANDGIRCSSLLSRDKAHLARDEPVAKTFDAKKSHQRSPT